MQSQFQAIRFMLGDKGAAENAAEKVVEFL
jgi:hypothetical protein